ncbi:hypothetical protein THIOM_002723 [Candidatus Thiomargarita nelsonii]|uniref:Uncharacterized protein n=1 Tax=Candidatus Thiomargarita nelsonii TaxID=1003181 RepID=A0A176S0M9_9GAMM|nr:hypothetical protein THIOM_002723 [Candidatus Thiomargarita nelsonii]
MGQLSKSDFLCNPNQNRGIGVQNLFWTNCAGWVIVLDGFFNATPSVTFKTTTKHPLQITSFP